MDDMKEANESVLEPQRTSYGTLMKNCARETVGKESESLSASVQ